MESAFLFHKILNRFHIVFTSKSPTLQCNILKTMRFLN